MKDNDKPQPQSLDRPDPRAELAAALKQAATGAADDDLTISFAVSGGVHEQRYDFAFASRSNAIEECMIDCELSDRHARTASLQAAPQLITDLSKQLVRSGVLDVEPEQRLFLPDTLIGQIEIQQGDRAYRVLFAADPDQAAVQDATPSKAVLAAADALYTAAGAVLDVDNVRP
jgi:hypothetical protein